MFWLTGITKQSPKSSRLVLLVSLPHTKFDVINMADVLLEAGTGITAYSSGAPESTPSFLVGSMLFSCFSCCVYVLFLSCPCTCCFLEFVSDC